MSYKQIGALLLLFLGGYSGVAAVGPHPTALIWDWQALIAGLAAAGLANQPLSDASQTVAIATTIGAFICGYGTIEVAMGWRYYISFDMRAIQYGLIAAGLVHKNNQNLIQSAFMRRMRTAMPLPKRESE